MVMMYRHKLVSMLAFILFYTQIANESESKTANIYCIEGPPESMSYLDYLMVYIITAQKDNSKNSGAQDQCHLHTKCGCY